MLPCPSCRGTLTPPQKGPTLVCRACKGRAVPLQSLRKTAGDDAVNKIAAAVRAGEVPRKRVCPICGALMATVQAPRLAAASTIPVDVCTACSYVWFDPKEYAAV